MSVYAIADLHLSLSPDVDKPMDIYGSRWINHVSRIRDSWCSMIKDEDTVIIAGDISWGLKINDAVWDLDWVSSLPGQKVMFKGNHDLWWKGISKLNRMYDDITFVQNDFYFAEGIYFCGSRGWITPDNDEFGEDDEKIYNREVLRMRASFEKAEEDIRSRYGNVDLRSEDLPFEIMGVMHYPPVSKTSSFSSFQQIFDDYGVRRVIYGHVHGEEGFRCAIKGNYHGVEYMLTSADYLNCAPVCIKR